MSFFQNYAPYNENEQDNNIYNDKYVKYKNKYLRQKEIMTGGDKTQLHLVKADWCGHCKHYKPIFNEFKNQILNNNNITIIEVNADDENTENKILYKKYNIDGFPTTIIEKNNNIIKLVGKKSVDELFDAINEIGNNEIGNNEIGNNENETRNNENEIIIYNFNTTWCSHSKNFEPIWNKFSNLLKQYNNVKAIDVKCDLNENINFCSKFNVQTVPMIVISRNNKLTTYNGPRKVEALITEINNN